MGCMGYIIWIVCMKVDTSTNQLFSYVTNEVNMLAKFTSLVSELNNQAIHVAIVIHIVHMTYPIQPMCVCVCVNLCACAFVGACVCLHAQTHTHTHLVNE